MGPRVSRSKWRRSDCTSCLAYLESTFLLLGYLGVNIFFCKQRFHSHVEPTIYMYVQTYIYEPITWGIFCATNCGLNIWWWRGWWSSALLQASDEFWVAHAMPIALWFRFSLQQALPASQTHILYNCLRQPNNCTVNFFMGSSGTATTTCRRRPPVPLDSRLKPSSVTAGPHLLTMLQHMH